MTKNKTDNKENEADKLRELLKPYLEDVQKFNSEQSLNYAKKNLEIVKRGGIPSTYHPPFKQPSFNDLMYWVQKAGDYKDE